MPKTLAYYATQPAANLIRDPNVKRAILAFIAEGEAVGAAKGVQHFDLSSYMAANGGASLLNDARHPNTTGHTLIANRLNSLIV